MDTYEWGILSDIHIDKDRIEALWKDVSNPAERLNVTRAYLTRKAERVVEAARVLLDEYSAQGFVLNGDLCDMVLIYDEREKQERSNRELLHEDSRRSMKLYFETILNGIAMLGLPVYVQPGSHESINVYDETVRKVAAAHGNVIDVLHMGGLSVKRFDSSLGNALVFVPGSDVLSGEGHDLGGGYKLGLGEAGDRMIATYRDAKGKIKYTSDEQFSPDAFDARGNMVHRLYRTDPRDLEKVVTDPNRTIVFCHVPPRFEGTNAVDYARSIFIQELVEDGTKNVGVMDAAPYEQEAFRIYSKSQTRRESHNKLNDEDRRRKSYDDRLEILRGLLAHDNRTQDLRECNIGSEDLLKAYEGRVLVAVNGHAHNSAGFAHGWDLRRVDEGDATRNLFWNASCLTRGYVGLLTEHGDGRVAYQNVDLRRHINWPKDLESLMKRPEKSALITRASGLTAGGIIIPGAEDMRKLGVIPHNIRMPPNLKRR